MLTVLQHHFYLMHGMWTFDLTRLQYGILDIVLILLWEHFRSAASTICCDLFRTRFGIGQAPMVKMYCHYSKSIENKT